MMFLILKVIYYKNINSLLFISQMVAGNCPSRNL